MSLPPNVIRVKRKRVEESPVTFLHIDEGTKRHRSDSSHWVYKRRGSATTTTATSTIQQTPKPQIQLSAAEDGVRDKPTKQDESKLTLPAAEPRRFRVSKAMLAAATANNAATKRDRHGTPTLFVERSRRKKLAPKPRRSMLGLQDLNNEEQKPTGDVVAKDLKRPGVKRAPAKPTASPNDDIVKDKDAASAAGANPLPPSLTNRGAADDMDKIAADMNEWVMREVGAGLQSQEAERIKEAKTPVSPSRFKPKAPAKRYHERHPEVPAPGTVPMDVEGDTNMTDASEEEDGDDDDWVIEEYIRIPANSVAMDVAPTDVGFLVLDGEEESLLFFGPQNDDDEDWNEDEEDENAENHYTADYPEDEVDSEDEFNRNAYYFRNRNASDDEEYDQDAYDEEEDAYSGREDDDDARMARILEQMKRLKAAQR